LVGLAVLPLLQVTLLLLVEVAVVDLLMLVVAVLAVINLAQHL
jgi:hypothetical protein